MSEQVTVGRIVHYVSYGTPKGEYTSQCRAAIVTEVEQEHTSQGVTVPEQIGLAVINPTGVFFHPIPSENGACVHSEDDKRGGTWHWPER